MEEGIFQHRSTLDSVNNNGSRLCQLSTGEGAIVIENQMSQANQKFEKLSEQVQRKAERIELSLQRKFDVNINFHDFHYFKGVLMAMLCIDKMLSQYYKNIHS